MSLITINTRSQMSFLLKPQTIFCYNSKTLLWVFIEQSQSHKIATIVFFNRKILYSLNQTTRCQTFMDILKKRKKTNKQTNDT